MLDWNTVIYYIKGRLALPSTFIEKSDAEMKKWILMTANKEFSNYIPDINWAVVDPMDNMFQTDQQNVYKFFDDEELAVYGARNYYFSQTGYFATGSPVFPAMSFDGVKEMALAAFRSNIMKPYSLWGYTAKYIRPNSVRILPQPTEPFIVEYEREQPHDLRKVPGEHHRSYLDLALAEMMIQIGSLRSSYGDGTIETPWGAIPLRGADLKTEGLELRDKVVETLKEASIPGVIIQFG